MGEDLYALWLHVSPGERPPNHYALLGLEPLCDDREAIERAVRARLDQLDAYALHPERDKRDACTRMMNEVARARVCLVNPSRKDDYDRALADRLGLQPPKRKAADGRTSRQSAAQAPRPAAEAFEALARRHLAQWTLDPNEERMLLAEAAGLGVGPADALRIIHRVDADYVRQAARNRRIWRITSAAAAAIVLLAAAVVALMLVDLSGPEQIATTQPEKITSRSPVEPRPNPHGPTPPLESPVLQSGDSAFLRELGKLKLEAGRHEEAADDLLASMRIKQHPEAGLLLATALAERAHALALGEQALRARFHPPDNAGNIDPTADFRETAGLAYIQIARRVALDPPGPEIDDKLPGALSKLGFKVTSWQTHLDYYRNELIVSGRHGYDLSNPDERAACAIELELLRRALARLGHEDPDLAAWRLGDPAQGPSIFIAPWPSSNPGPPDPLAILDAEHLRGQYDPPTDTSSDHVDGRVYVRSFLSSTYPNQVSQALQSMGLMYEVVHFTLPGRRGFSYGVRSQYGYDLANARHRASAAADLELLTRALVRIREDGMATVAVDPSLSANRPKLYRFRGYGQPPEDLPESVLTHPPDDPVASTPHPVDPPAREPPPLGSKRVVSVKPADLADLSPRDQHMVHVAVARFPRRPDPNAAQELVQLIQARGVDVDAWYALDAGGTSSEIIVLHRSQSMDRKLTLLPMRLADAQRRMCEVLAEIRKTHPELVSYDPSKVETWPAYVREVEPPAGVAGRPALPAGVAVKWPFDAAEAARRQDAAARQLGVAKEIDIELADGVKIKLALIPAGRFQMGSSKDEVGRRKDEKLHEVTISRALYMSVCEVSEAQYYSFAPYDAEARRVGRIPNPKIPASGAYDQVEQWCHRVSQKTGRTLRLPTEAEWEYACRAGTATRYHFGDAIDLGKARYNQAADRGIPQNYAMRRTKPVGSYAPNAWGLHDMHGNVAEWVAGAYAAYPDKPVVDPHTPWTYRSQQHVVRGGTTTDSSWDVRSASRITSGPGTVVGTAGIRLVMEIDPPAPANATAPATTQPATVGPPAHPGPGAPTPGEQSPPADYPPVAPVRDALSRLDTEGYDPPPPDTPGQWPRDGRKEYLVVGEYGRYEDAHLLYSLLVQMGLKVTLHMHPIDTMGSRFVVRSLHGYDTDDPEIQEKRPREYAIFKEAITWIHATYPWLLHNPPGHYKSLTFMPYSRRQPPKPSVLTAEERKRAKIEAGRAAAEKRQADQSRQLGLGKQIALELPGGVKLPLVFVPHGDFWWGRFGAFPPDPDHSGTITITRPFYIGQFEVTQAQWKAVTGNEPWKDQPAKTWADGVDNPAGYISHTMAVAFCKKLSTLTGRTVRLPTEAEWEYACRAGSPATYCFGESPSLLRYYGWTDERIRLGKVDPHPQPVGKLRPNSWGIFDMHGNVAEWCGDWYDRDYYARRPQEDPFCDQPDLPANVTRVIRGGSLQYGASCSSSHRRGWPATDAAFWAGLRVVVEIDPQVPAKATAPATTQPQAVGPQ